MNRRDVLPFQEWLAAQATTAWCMVGTAVYQVGRNSSIQLKLRFSGGLSGRKTAAAISPSSAFFPQPASATSKLAAHAIVVFMAAP